MRGRISLIIEHMKRFPEEGGSKRSSGIGRSGNFYLFGWRDVGQGIAWIKEYSKRRGWRELIGRG